MSLALLFISISSFAQSNSIAEVEDALKDFITEYNKSPYDFFKNRCTADFRFTDGNGKFSFLPSILKNNEKRPSFKSDVSELKTFQSGDLCVVSGIHSYEGAGKIAFTYTFEKKAGKWMFAASQHTSVKTETAPVK